LIVLFDITFYIGALIPVYYGSSYGSPCIEAHKDIDICTWFGVWLFRWG